MMNTILTLILIGLSFTMGETRYKAYSDEEGQYLVLYQIDTSQVAFENENGRHYEAVITVLELVGEDSIQVYQPLRGIYADGECVCDSPKKIVERYRKLEGAEIPNKPIGLLPSGSIPIYPYAYRSPDGTIYAGHVRRGGFYEVSPICQKTVIDQLPSGSIPIGIDLYVSPAGDVWTGDAKDGYIPAYDGLIAIK